MTYLLAVETATKVCSVALFANEELLLLREEKGDYSHAENLAVFTEEILNESNLSATDLSAVIVSKGPGSYTGLRIGVSFAKGLCYSLNIPLISIDTLYALALGYHQSQNKRVDFICPMIDARRMEVYSAIYDVELNCVKSISADIVENDSYADILKIGSAVVIGDGAAKCASILGAENRVFHSDFLCSATYLGKEGYKKFQQKEFENVAYFEPFYLKEFIALKSKKSLI